MVMIAGSIEEPAPVDYRLGMSKARSPLNSCPFCGGTATVQAPIEYPDFDNSHCCSHCEEGRELAARLARIVAKTLESTRA